MSTLKTTEQTLNKEVETFLRASLNFEKEERKIFHLKYDTAPYL